MYKNIKKVRQYFKLNQEVFGKRLGVTGAAISRLENGTRNPSEQIILAICREFNINEQWLKTGEGEMFLPKMEDNLIAYLSSRGINKKMQAFITAYLSLSDDYKEAVDKYIDIVYDEMQTLKEIEDSIDLTRPEGLSDDEWDMIVEKRKAKAEQERLKQNVSSGINTPEKEEQTRPAGILDDEWEIIQQLRLEKDTTTSTALRSVNED